MSGWKRAGASARKVWSRNRNSPYPVSLMISVLPLTGAAGYLQLLENISDTDMQKAT